MNAWRLCVVITVVAILCGVTARTDHRGERPTVAVTIVGYEPTASTDRQAAAMRNLIMSDLRDVGFNPIAGILICDDPNDGAEKLGAQYYVLVTPSSTWNRAALALYKVGNRVTLRRETITIQPAATRLAKVHALMQKQAWSVAFLPNEGC